MKTQDMTLLCPCCQLTRRATIGIDIKDEPESLEQDTAVNMGLSIMASCPSCGANMYQADDDLVDAQRRRDSYDIPLQHFTSQWRV